MIIDELINLSLHITWNLFCSCLLLLTLPYIWISFFIKDTKKHLKISSLTFSHSHSNSQLFLHLFNCRQNWMLKITFHRAKSHLNKLSKQDKLQSFTSTFLQQMSEYKPWIFICYLKTAKHPKHSLKYKSKSKHDNHCHDNDYFDQRHQYLKHSLWSFQVTPIAMKTLSLDSFLFHHKMISNAIIW